MTLCLHALNDFNYATFIIFRDRSVLSGYEIVYKWFTNYDDRGMTPENGIDCDITKHRIPCEMRGQIYHEFVIPITRLIHVTHLDAAASISNLECNDSKYVFKSNAKRGKSGAHTTWVYRDDDDLKFWELFNDECVFCKTNDCQCSFIWWGIDVDEWYKCEGMNMRKRIDDLESQRIYTADFLHNPPESTYGTQGFSIKFSTLIKRYKESRTDSNATNVCFKMGGTLRYYKEISYVIIVSMGEELFHLPCIDSQTSRGIFQYQGLLNELGEVQDLTKTPYFKVKYLIKYVSRYPDKGPLLFSWENLAFAFYYPSNGHCQLKCNVGDIDIRAMSHFLRTCHVNDPCPDHSSLVKLNTLLAKHKYCRFCDLCNKFNCTVDKHKCICKGTTS